MSGDRPIFVFSSPTTPNGDLHLGHLGGPYLGADAYVRFQRMNGAQVFHVAGSDDFQSYVVGAARRDGRSCQETAAHYSAEILATHQLMDISIDEYTVSAAEPGYRERVQRFFSRVAASDSVTLRADPALFDANGEYLYEVDASGDCPTCGHPTGGNMCEECGEPNFCADLVDPASGRSDAAPVVGELRRYSLALPDLQGAVESHQRLGRVPARVKELTHRLFARGPLPVAITHPGEWGVAPVEAGVDGQVIWVWVDMAYRFLHGAESIGRRIGADWSAEQPDPDWKFVHFMGFDNTFYHTIFVPAMYHLAYPDWQPDIDYNLNEFSLLDDSKFSTSRRHAVWGKDILSPETVDGVRCYLSWMRPEGRRTNFVLAEYGAFVADVLIGQWQTWLSDLGRRIERDHGGQAPEPGEWTPEHRAFLARLENRRATMSTDLGADGFSLNAATRSLVGIVNDARTFARAEGYAAGLATGREQTRTAIALELAAARLLSRVSAPVMPRFAGRLAATLGDPAPAHWPSEVELVPAGTSIALSDQAFFGAAPAPASAPAEAAPVPAETALVPAEAAPAPSVVLAWLNSIVSEALQQDPAETDGQNSLALLGVTSMQSIALQYQILDRTGVDISIEQLLGERSLADIADELELAMPAEMIADLIPAETAAEPRP